MSNRESSVILRLSDEDSRRISTQGGRQPNTKG
jgi:hypothetical protein